VVPVAACPPMNITKDTPPPAGASLMNWQNIPLSKEMPFIPLLINY
jgi:hypothetical protein